VIKRALYVHLWIAYLNGTRILILWIDRRGGELLIRVTILVKKILYLWISF